jgi:hypothetical protein
MAFNLFRKKTENELRCEFLKQEEHSESQLTLAFTELLKEWAALEANYCVGLHLIQQRMGEIPQRFE